MGLEPLLEWSLSWCRCHVFRQRIPMLRGGNRNFWAWYSVRGLYSWNGLYFSGYVSRLLGVYSPCSHQCRCGVLAVNTVWSTPERIRGEVLTTMRYTNRCLPLPLPSRYTRLNVVPITGLAVTDINGKFPQILNFWKIYNINLFYLPVFTYLLSQVW